VIAIAFSAFSSLQPKLARKRVAYNSARLEIPEGTTAEQLVARLGLGPRDVEAVFVNGRVVPPGSVLRDGDRVALVPPGTPGPYRALLGMVKPTS
jgi:sulfur carrier protein ThiS